MAIQTAAAAAAKLTLGDACLCLVSFAVNTVCLIEWTLQELKERCSIYTSSINY